MKKIISIIFAVISAVCIPLSALPISAESGELLDAVVFADENMFDDISNAESTLTGICSDTQIVRSFTEALFGFHVRLTPDAFAEISQSEMFSLSLVGNFSPLQAESAEYSEASVYALDTLGITEVQKSGYLGSGTVVAVIDSGFDVAHEVFESIPKNPKLTRENVDSLTISNNLHASQSQKFQSPYISEKIPFAFDYTSYTTDVSATNSHGTHVAAIIGGKSETMTGVVPECQLLLMKVFASSVENASEISVIYALEDAAALGADVINLSLGTYSGFSYSGSAIAFNKIADRLTAKGITVVCAAGNDGTVGYKSTYADAYGIKYPLADMADFGTVNSPGSIESFISVASAENTHKYNDTLVHVDKDGKITRIEYTDTNAQFDIIKTTFTRNFDSQVLEYVSVPGLGEIADYKKINVTGKIALIERGVITFAQKIQNAAQNGAVAVIIYDNTESDGMTLMEIEGCTIPAVFISEYDGLFLKNSQVKRLSFDSALRSFAPNENANMISQFSSRGPTPERVLKPDITAIGESIYSAASGGTYTALSGTSMATPFVSGAAAAICEKLAESEPSLDISERPDLIKRMLLSSAKPIKDNISETEFSARSQGFGMLDLSAALEETLLLSGFDTTNAELVGDNTFYEFEITVENRKSESSEITLTPTFLRDRSAELVLEDESRIYFNSLCSEKLENTQVNAEANGVALEESEKGSFKLKLKPHEILNVYFEVYFDEDELFKDAAFENGFFIDGFIYLSSDNKVSSIPLLGYCGDFSDSSMFDNSIYDNKQTFLSGNRFLSKNSLGEHVLLGVNENSLPIENLVAFSPDFDGECETLYFAPSLFRNIKDFKYEILDANGKVLFTEIDGYPLVKGDYDNETAIEIWDGGDKINSSFRYPDGEYILKFTAYSVEPGDTQTLFMKFAIDTVAPKLDYSYLSVKDGKTTLTINTNDSIGVKNAVIYTDGKSAKDERITYSPTSSCGNSFEFDITELCGDYIWADITDYAMNTRTVRIIAPDYMKSSTRN